MTLNNGVASVRLKHDYVGHSILDLGASGKSLLGRRRRVSQQRCTDRSWTTTAEILTPGTQRVVEHARHRRLRPASPCGIVALWVIHAERRQVSIGIQRPHEASLLGR